MSAKNKSRTVVVTGASSGIGLATARAFRARGDTVYSLSRTAPPDEFATFLPCDVTDDASVEAAIRTVVGEAGRIDVLVLSAGFGVSGAAECTQMADARRQFDVCFFGALRVVQQALPILREKGGTVIFLSSVAANVAIPFQSFYSAAKSAVNALVLALRNELRAYPVRVCAVLPGDVRTGFTAARKKESAGAALYPAMARSVATMEHDEQTGMPPERIADKIVSLAGQRNPKPFCTVGLQYKFFLLLAKLLPARLCNWLVGLIYAK